ncbi:MAG: hypothetical protein JKX68_00175 [Flavobacteriales bacterium]|nr:hypothetical protein [Flavobacteriales bacterium]
MKKLILCFVAVISMITTNAQNTTTGNTEEEVVTEKSAVLVVPFESKMYLSDIDRDLALKNEMNFQDIKAKFRAALDREIFIALKQYYKPLSFYAIDPKESVKELAYIYNSIGYKYEVVPEEVVVKKETAGKKFLKKFKKKKKEKKYIEAGVENGQIVSEVDNREKYMKTKLTNEKLLPNLNKKYRASYYVFINQLDIKRSADMRYVATEEQYKREIKVHYTIFDDTGKEVSSGAIKTRFPAGQNDIDKIIKIQFPLIAERIVSNLIGPDQAVVE